MKLPLNPNIQKDQNLLPGRAMAASWAELGPKGLLPLARTAGASRLQRISTVSMVSGIKEEDITLGTEDLPQTITLNGTHPSLSCAGSMCDPKLLQITRTNVPIALSDSQRALPGQFCYAR